MAEGTQVGLPCFRTVQRQIGIPAPDIIRILKRRDAGEYGMIISELNDPFDIFPDILARLTVVPFGPAGLIVLTIGIVVAELCVKILISGVDKRSTLGEE